MVGGAPPRVPLPVGWWQHGLVFAWCPQQCGAPASTFVALVVAALAVSLVCVSLPPFVIDSGVAFNPGAFVRLSDSETGVPSSVKAACASIPVVEVHYTNALVAG